MTVSVFKKSAIFNNQTFKKLDLSYEEVREKTFNNCKFIHCNMSDAILARCTFTDCEFENCNLALTKLTLSRFNDCVFDECKLVGVSFADIALAQIPLASPLQFYRSNLDNASFFGLSLAEIVLTECTAKGADFRETDLSSSDLRGTDFDGALFNGTNLINANFVDAVNYNIDINYNKLKKAKFSLPEAANLLRCLEIELY